MKNSSLKMKRVVGVILAFLMVFNLVVFTGQVGAFAETGSGESSSGSSSEKVTVSYLTEFKEITDITDIDGKSEVVMIPEKYTSANKILCLPDGSAIVNAIAKVSENEKISKYITDNALSDSYYSQSINYAIGTNCIDTTDTGNVELVKPIKSSSKFDGCPYGTMKYFTYDDTSKSGWYYNCSGGAVKKVGPFYVYTYKTETIDISPNDIVIKAKDTFTPSIMPSYIDESDFEATITVGNEVINMSSITLDSSDNFVNPLEGDCTVTAVFGMGDNVVEKEVVAAVQLTSSDIRAKLNTSKYSGTSSKTFTTDDVVVEYRVDDQWYETDRFELLDATVNPLNSDTTISISFAGINKTIEAAVPITGDVKANGTTGVKELITKVSTITPKAQSVINNNSISTVEAAIHIMETEKLDKYVNEAIDLGDANVAVKQDGTAAKLQAKVNTLDASVITNSLTPEEIIRVLAGEKVDLRLEVVVDETTDAKETTGGQLIESNLNTNESAYYFTADLYKIFNEDEDNKSSITEFSDAISFTIDIPEEIRSEGRVFTLVASHELADGTFETFNLVDTDDDDATFTASTTKLCTMALVYADEVVAEAPIIEPEVVLNDGDASPQTADLKNVLWTFIITVSAGAVLAVAFRKEFL